MTFKIMLIVSNSITGKNTIRGKNIETKITFISLFDDINFNSFIKNPPFINHLLYRRFKYHLVQ
jgi:hypothetical protein